MIRHSLLVIQKAVNKLNPTQVPVVAADQPLFAIAKQVQWQWPGLFGEDKLVIMMGGLHIEMAGLRMIGHWLGGSGWHQSLVEAGVVTPGIAESFLHASNVKRTRYAHAVTASALYYCQQLCYSDYCKHLLLEDAESAKSFSEWRDNAMQNSAQFQYWDTVLQLELLILTFVRSLREGHFTLYVESLERLLPWFFAMDQTHYSRWLPVHVRDMLLLKSLHPQIYDSFMSGHFTVSKSNRSFSSMSIDQAHEQLNALLKGDGGVIGLTDNDTALIRWTTAGPEIVRIVCEFESSLLSSSDDNLHHEQQSSYQRRFVADVRSLAKVFHAENVFCSSAAMELMILCSHDFADKSVVESVRTAEQIGQQQMCEFVDKRLKGSLSLFAPLPRNKLKMFSYRPSSKTNQASRLKVRELKSDCELFSRLYIACQTRDGDLDDFFRHENQPYPPSLSHHGSLRFGTKSDLLPCLTSLLAYDEVTDISTLSVDCYILDGAVIVQMASPTACKTFDDYRTKVFVPIILSYLKHASRVDVVFDVYRQNSLKSCCREKRGSGTRTCVLPNTKIPSNWHQFLFVDENKQELFHFLAETNISTRVNHIVLASKDDSVRFLSGSLNTNSVAPCSHEEADTRILLHCLHASEHGARKIAMRTVDTDVVVLAIAYYKSLKIDELWIHFGVGKAARLLSIRALSEALGSRKSAVLPVFHAMTGCDTVSCFFGKGKKSAWDTWLLNPEVTNAFESLLSLDGSENDNSVLSVLARFVIIMYDRTSECTDLDSARKQIFTKKSKSLESLPPTSGAFLQHVRRVVHQSVHYWSHCLEKTPASYEASQWGWMKDGDKWSPFWTALPEVSDSSRELIHCSCKKACSGRCKCTKANLACTALCHCDGECSRT